MSLGIDVQFDRAVGIVQQLPRDGPIATNYDEKLSMYSLFKQATEGNVSGSRPSIFNMLERAKWDAWSTQKDLSSSEAKFLYSELLKKILKRHSDKAIGVELLYKLRKPIRSDSESSDASSSSSASLDNPSLRLAIPSVTESDPVVQGQIRLGSGVGSAWESTRSLPHPYTQKSTKNDYRRVQSTLSPSKRAAQAIDVAVDEGSTGETRTASEARLQSLEAKLDKLIDLVNILQQQQQHQARPSKMSELARRVTRALTAKKTTISAIGLIMVTLAVEHLRRRYQLSRLLSRKFTH